MKRTKNVFSGITFGVINNFLNILLPFVSRTIIIHQLGVEYVGLKGVFTSVLQVLSLSELGFGAAISYLLYKPIAEKNVDKVNAILLLYRRIYRIIGVVILALSIALIPFLDKLVTGDVPNDISIYILYSIYVLNTVISYFFFAYKKILFSANQRYDIEVSINSIILILQNVVQIIILILVKNYYAYVIILPIMTIINNITSYIVVNKKYPMYRCKGTLSREEIKEIKKNTGGAFFSKIGSTVYMSVDNIVISAFLGITILGIYDNYYYVVASIIAVFSVLHNSLRPVIGNILIVENNEKKWSTFRKVNYFYMLFVIICTVGICILTQDFELIWGGKNNLLGIEIVYLLTTYFFIGRLSSVLTIFQEAAGLYWQGKFIPLVAAAINLGINIFLVHLIGLPGIVISSIISAFFISFPGYAYIIFRYLFNEKKYIKLFLIDSLKILIQLIIVIPLSFFVSKMINVTGWWTLILKGLVAESIVLVVLFLFNIKRIRIKDTIQFIKNRIISKNVS